LYIKELSIIDGGIGCAVWDAAIILSRFIYENEQLFGNKTVCELGAGVGLPGIMAARFAQKCYLTDYIETIQENMEYNVKINSTVDDDETDDPIQQKKNEYRRQVAKSAHVCMLNWDDIKTMPNPQPDIPLGTVDILLGSELTYTGNENTINCLLEIVFAYMSRPNGIFIEVLSDDRDGVTQFLEDGTRLGMSYRAVAVPAHLLGNFGTKQQAETYKLYLFARTEDVNAGNTQYQQVCEIFDRYENK
jgi:predicted nicotinamide N-methyase